MSQLILTSAVPLTSTQIKVVAPKKATHLLLMYHFLSWKM